MKESYGEGVANRTGRVGGPAGRQPGGRRGVRPEFYGLFIEKRLAVIYTPYASQSTSSPIL